MVTKGIKNGIAFPAINWLLTIKLFRFPAEVLFSFEISFLDSEPDADVK